jgi:hypothetical protein
MTYLLI